MARTPIHPGEILDEELKELGMSARNLAEILGVPSNRLSQIIGGKRDITADTALRLARYFGTSPDFWMNLQRPTTWTWPGSRPATPSSGSRPANTGRPPTHRAEKPHGGLSGLTWR